MFVYSFLIFYLIFPQNLHLVPNVPREKRYQPTWGPERSEGKTLPTNIGSRTFQGKTITNQHGVPNVPRENHNQPTWRPKRSEGKTLPTNMVSQMIFYMFRLKFNLAAKLYKCLTQIKILLPNFLIKIKIVPKQIRGKTNFQNILL